MKWKSALVTDLSGKLGGMVASRNAGGNYFRAYANPVQPQTCRQNTARSVFAELSSMYANGSAFGFGTIDRQAWDDAAAAIGPTLKDFCGDAPITGQNLFIQQNAAVKQAQATFPDNANLPGIILAPPTNLIQSPPAVSVTVPTTINGTDWTYTIDYVDPIPEDSWVIVYHGIPQNPGRNFYGGPYQLGATGNTVGQEAESQVTVNIDLQDPQTWASDYNLVVDRKTPIKVVTISPDYLISQRFECLTGPAVEIEPT